MGVADTGRVRVGFADEAARVDATDRDPLVAGIGRFARDVLAPRALEHDHAGVPAAVLERLRDLGALHYGAPLSHGGSGPDRSTDRRVHEHLAYGCLNTWLIWAQHAAIVGRLARDVGTGGDVSPLAQRVVRGQVLAGAGVSDVRRFPRGHVSAVATDDGWIFDGTVSWVSGWGLNDALLVAAVEATTERVVTALVPVSAQTEAAPLRLAAVGGSHTVRLGIRAVDVPAVDVVAVEPLSTWQAADRAATSDTRPHVFGSIARVLDELRAETSAAEVVAGWAGRVADLRVRAYALAEEATAVDRPLHRVDERLALKSAATEALVTLAQALLVARAGRGLAGDDTAQLHARSALFLLVQGQTATVRETQLRRLAAAAPATAGAPWSNGDR